MYGSIIKKIQEGFSKKNSFLLIILFIALIPIGVYVWSSVINRESGGGNTSSQKDQVDQVDDGEKSGFDPRIKNARCVITGCNGEICTDISDVSDSGVSLCMYREEYACYKNASCDVQQDGKCGWTYNEELNRCLDSFGVQKESP